MNNQKADGVFRNLDNIVEQLVACRKRTDDEVSKNLGAIREQLVALAQSWTQLKEDGVSATDSLAVELKRLRDAVSGGDDRVAALEREVGEHKEIAKSSEKRAADLERKCADLEQGRVKAETRAKDAERELAAVREDVEALRSRTNEASKADQALRSELDKALAEVESLRAKAEKMKAAEKLAEAERRRADEFAEKYLQETAKGTKAVIAQQLADALQEAEALRAEVAGLRAKAVPAPAATQEPPPPPPARKPRPELRRNLGDILLEAGVLTQDQLTAASDVLVDQPNRTLGEILIEQELASEEQVAQALASQHRVLFMHLDEQAIEPGVVSLLNGKLAQRHLCVPVKIVDDAIILAMTDPLDLIAIEDVEKATGRAVRPVISTPAQIVACIHRLYSEPEPVE